MIVAGVAASVCPVALKTHRVAVNSLPFTDTAASAYTCGCVGQRIRLRWLSQPYLFL